MIEQRPARPAPFASPAMLVGLVRLADAGSILVLGFVAYMARHATWEVPARYWLAIVLCMLFASQAFQLGRLYDFRLLDSLTRQFGKLVAAWGSVFLALIALMFFSKTSEDFSRVWAALWLGGSFLAFVSIRIGVKLQMRHWRRQGRLSRVVAIVGAGDHARRLVEHLKRQPEDLGIRLIGLFDDRRTRVPVGEMEGLPILGGVEDLLRHARRERIDLAIVALPWQAEQRLLDIMGRLRQAPMDVVLCPDHIGFRLFERPVSHLAGLPMLAVYERPISGWSSIVKATEDRLLAALALLIAGPLMALVALAVKLDSAGPVLFRQPRYGFNNQVITVRKFRTMQHGIQAEATVPQATRADPRVTRLGRFLRRSSLDELPQLFNVLDGSMSLVGPRPHAVPHNEHYAKLIAHYYARHRVKPGITGWAQVNGLRGETETPEKMERRVQYDLYYIEHWSLLLDLKILLLTLFVGLHNDNAY